MFIPQSSIQDFPGQIYRGFVGGKIEIGTVCNVQIVNSYQKSLFDVAVGLRRDEQALAIYRNSRRFVLYNKESQLELADVFKLLLEARGSLPAALEQKIVRYRSGDEKIISPQKPKEIFRKDSRSRSRDKEKEVPRQEEKAITKKKEGWADILWALFAPKDWTKQSLIILLADTLRCAKNEILVESSISDEIPYFEIYLKNQSLANSLLAGTRATEGVVLLIRQEQVKEQGLLSALKQRQLKAIRISSSQCEHPFNELCRYLVSFRDFNLRVVAVVPYQQNFIVIVQNRVLMIIRFLRIAGWKFQAVSQCIRFSPSSTDKWHKFLNASKLH